MNDISRDHYAIGPVAWHSPNDINRGTEIQKGGEHLWTPERQHQVVLWLRLACRPVKSHQINTYIAVHEVTRNSETCLNFGNLPLRTVRLSFVLETCTRLVPVPTRST